MGANDPKRPSPTHSAPLCSRSIRFWCERTKNDPHSSYWPESRTLAPTQEKRLRTDIGPKVSGTAIRRRPRRSPAGRIVSLAASISALTLAAWSRNVTPASVIAAPRVVRARSWTPSSASSRNSRRLTIDLETPSRRAAAETPPASATSTNVIRSWTSNSAFPISRHGVARKSATVSQMAMADVHHPGSAAVGARLPANQPYPEWQQRMNR